MPKRTEDTDGTADTGAAVTTGRRRSSRTSPSCPTRQARDELIGIVAQLEGGQAGLEESMHLWQRGEALAAHCSTWLDERRGDAHRRATDD